MIVTNVGKPGLLGKLDFGVAALGEEERLAGQGESPLRGDAVSVEPAPRERRAGIGVLGSLEVDRADAAATVGLELVRHALVGVERLHSGGLDGADVDERVVRAIIGLDEAEALVGVEEFDST